MHCTYTIDYTGRTLSINQIERMNGKSCYRVRKSMENQFALLMLAAQVRRMEWAEVTLAHNTKLDMDNIAATVKPFADALKRRYLPEDDKRFWDYLAIKYVPDLPKGLMRFTITGELTPKAKKSVKKFYNTHTTSVEKVVKSK